MKPAQLNHQKPWVDGKMMGKVGGEAGLLNRAAYDEKQPGGQQYCKNLLPRHALADRAMWTSQQPSSYASAILQVP